MKRILWMVIGSVLCLAFPLWGNELALVGEWPADMALQGMAVGDGYMYAGATMDEARGKMVTHVLDVSDPSAPSVVGEIVDVMPYAMHLEGNTLYVLGMDMQRDEEPGGLHMFDVNTPAVPERIGFLPLNPLGTTLTKSGDRIYTVVGDLLNIIDVGHPGNPYLVGQYQGLGDVASDVAVSGQYAYVLCGEGDAMVRVINIEDPTQPMEVAQWVPADWDADDVALFAGITVSGRYAYIASSRGAERQEGDSWYNVGLRVLDIGDPFAPVEIGAYVREGLNSSYNVALSGDYAYVLSVGMSIRLEAINVSDPTHPSHEATYGGFAVGGMFDKIAVRGGTVYVNDDAGIHIFQHTGVETSLWIRDIHPHQGADVGPVLLTIEGEHFESGAEVRLMRTGQPDIVGTGVIVSPTCIRAIVDLTHRARSSYDVVVTNPDGKTATLEGMFSIVEPSEGFWLDLIGRDQIMVGTEETVRIIYGNSGTAPIEGVVIQFEVPAPFELVRVVRQDGREIISAELTPFFMTTEEFLRPAIIYVPELAPGESRVLDASVFAPVKILFPNAKRAKPVMITTIQAPQVAPLIALCVWGGYGLASGFATTLGENWLNEYMDGYESGEAFDNAWDMTLDKWNWKEAGAGVIIGDVVGHVVVGPVQNTLKGAKLLLETFLENLAIRLGHNKKCAVCEAVSSYDPNDKAGPAGWGEGRHILPHQSMEYIVFFENLPEATAAARQIVIRDTLSTILDWETVTIGASSHPDHLTTSLDPTTGVLTWTFADIHLPPNVNPPEGEGWVRFAVDPKPNFPSGTEIRNKASIFFDFNPPIHTPEVVHVIDAGGPTSAVQALSEVTESASFEVRWSGEDDAGGSGIGQYLIYVSDNGAPYALWYNGEAVSETFGGQNGHTYAFYSIAVDGVGHTEEAPPSADAVTRVQVPTEVASEERAEVARSLGYVTVFPNPFQPDSGGNGLTFGHTSDVSRRLTGDTTIRIYNLLGQVVHTMQEARTGQAAGMVRWDGRNSQGRAVATGTYVYVIANPKGEKVMGKISILR